MKKIIFITIILWSMSAAYAGTSMLLHTFFNTDGGVIPSNCDGTIDASEGCPLPMLN